MSKKQKFTVQQVIKALKNNRGLVTQAAEELKVCPRTIYNYAERYPTVKETVETLRESRLDYTEGVLYDLIDKGEPAAVFFLLKTQGKKRGYVERQELTGADGESVSVRFVENIIGQPTSRPTSGPVPEADGIHPVG